MLESGLKQFMLHHQRALLTNKTSSALLLTSFIHLLCLFCTSSFTPTHLASAQREPTRRVRGGAWRRRPVGWRALKDTREDEFDFSRSKTCMLVTSAAVIHYTAAQQRILSSQLHKTQLICISDFVLAYFYIYGAPNISRQLPGEAAALRG